MSRGSTELAPRRRRSGLAAILVALALIAAACTSGHATQTPSIATPTLRESSIELQEPALDSMLVDIADMPGGWSARAPGGGEERPIVCQPGGFFPAAPERASRAFDRADDVLAQVLARFRSEADARDAYGASIDALAHCPDDTATQDGRTIEVSVEEHATPARGDDSRAFAIVLSDASSVSGADCVLVRKGATVLAVLARAASGRPSPDEVEAFVQMASSKIS